MKYLLKIFMLTTIFPIKLWELFNFSLDKMGYPDSLMLKEIEFVYFWRESGKLFIIYNMNWTEKIYWKIWYKNTDKILLKNYKY